ncbi:MAG: hypothetical protein SGI74_12145 [Oligoflexia bacterium]|nr:hypothetical protein [Oligoflexia bacterium]
MSKTMTPPEFDSRMVEWNLKHNVITKDQLKTFLSSLTDESENSQLLQIDDEDEAVELAVPHLGEQA